jgi:hypothetical protein
MATTATQVVLDSLAAELRLPATDGKTYALDDVAGEKGTVVVFICNHCPYVKAVIDRAVGFGNALHDFLRSRDDVSRGKDQRNFHAHSLRAKLKGMLNGLEAEVALVVDVMLPIDA